MKSPKTFTYESRDQRHQLYAVEYSPDKDPKAVLICVHGMSEHFGRYKEMCLFFASQGFCVVGVDLLGHGRSAKSLSELGYFCDIDPATTLVRDIHHLRKLVENDHKGLPVFLFGHSMGSFITRNYLNMYGGGLKGAILMGSCEVSPAAVVALMAILRLLSKLFGWRHRSTMVQALVMGPFSAAFPKSEQPFGWLTSRKEIVEESKKDPYLQKTFTLNGFYTLASLIWRMNKPSSLRRIPKSLPILLLSGAEDPVGHFGHDILKTEQLLKDIGVKNIEFKVYPSDRHELYHEKDRFHIFCDMIDFMNRCIDQ
ncbi:MAG: alpha/beta fold hydrolase [Lachnospiraceae bacterium]|nr:alpha/beta fold hydrolase [Lachnospiraceae bacterium]